MTKISVITTFYNPGNDIIDCIKSVTQQSFINYEHILVNDGSTDLIYGNDKRVKK